LTKRIIGRPVTGVLNSLVNDGVLWIIEMAYGVAFGLDENNLVHIFGILNVNKMPCGLN
jgi:hypothetical protein